MRVVRSLGALAALAVIGLVVVIAALWFSPRPDLYGGAVFSRVFTDRQGRLLRVTLTPDEKYRIFTPLERLPADMIEATLLYEDRSFYSHPGVNPFSLLRAMAHMAAGGRRMGGSTITMQLVRLTDRLDTTSVSGKLRQIWRALVRERHYDKHDILEAYLNLAPYGGNVEGVGAAAMVWFRKRPEQLTLPEILTLVPVPQNPSARHPLALVRATGHAASSAGGGDGAFATHDGKETGAPPPWRDAPDGAAILPPLSGARLRLHALWTQAHPHGPANLNSPAFARAPLPVWGPRGMPNEAPHAVDSLLAEGWATSGSSSTITTTLDLSLQHVVEQALRRAVDRGAVWGMNNAAALLVDWRTAEIRALVGSADFFNTAIQGQVDGTMARRSPGSTLKPFVYALALEQGLIHPLTILADTPRSFRGYEPENADGEFRGPLSARDALRASRNIPAISLAGQLHNPDLYGFLRRAGVNFAEPAEHYGLALVLGGAEVTMRELAGLYAALAHHGLWRKPTLRPWNTPSAAGSGFQRILSAEAAFLTLDMLTVAPASGSPGVPVAWKTGTSNGLRDAWTAGVFGPYALVVWVGSFDGQANPGFTGLGAAAPLFFDIARALRGHDGRRDEGWRQEGWRDSSGLRVLRVPVCAATGDVNTALCGDPHASPIAGGSGQGGVADAMVGTETGKLEQTWFIPGVSPIRDSGILREILVDTRTGLRQCRDLPGRTVRQVWEFWPADMRRLFQQAGVSKPRPPDFAPECQPEARGRAPVIVSPRPGVVYSHSLSRPGRVPLIADVDADAETVFWFAGEVFLGRSDAGDGDRPLFWTPEPGVTTLRVVDDLGRSASLRVTVDSVP